MSTSSISKTKTLGFPPKCLCNKVAIVIQGPYMAPDIYTIFERFLFHNSNIIIIFSTYLSSDISEDDDLFEFLSDYERKLVEDGTLIFIFNQFPPEDEFPDFWKNNHMNQNLQRLTSYAGLKLAQDLGIRYSLKIRSDTFLGKPGVIDYFLRELENYPVLHQNPPLVKLKSRIIVSGQGTIVNPKFEHPYHVRDHWYFGHTEDLVRFFDISSPSWANIKCISPESSLTQVWMQDLGIKVKDTAELIGRYFIVEDAYAVEQVRLSVTRFRFIDYEKYKTQGVEYLEEIYKNADPEENVTTKEEWNKILTSTWITETF